MTHLFSRGNPWRFHPLASKNGLEETSGGNPQFWWHLEVRAMVSRFSWKHPCLKNNIFSALELIHHIHRYISSAKEITYFVVILQEKAAFGDKDCTGVKMVARRRACHGTSLRESVAFWTANVGIRHRKIWGYHWHVLTSYTKTYYDHPAHPKFLPLLYPSLPPFFFLWNLNISGWFTPPLARFRQNCTWFIPLMIAGVGIHNWS